MSKKANRYIIIPVLFFCISGGTLFAFFGRKDSAVQQQELSERINLALRRAAHLLLKQAGDSTSTIAPVKQMTEKTYFVELKHAFVYDSLPSFIQNSFDFYDIKGKYDVAVWDCNYQKLILGYNSFDYQKNGEVTCVGRNQQMDCSNFSVTFAIPSVSVDGYWNLFIRFGGLFVLGLAASAYFYYKIPKKDTFFTPKDDISQTQDEENVNLIHIGNATFDTHNQTISINNVEQNLTFQEAKLLQLFCQNKNELLDRDYILKSVWGDEGVMITRSVDVFVSRLRKILKPDESIKIVNVHGRGYRFEVV